MCVSINNIAVRWHYDAGGGWPVSLLEKLGVTDLLDKWPSEVLQLGTRGTG